jgi:hypothetical protein
MYQAIHVQPTNLSSLIGSDGLWRYSWESIEKELKLQGDRSSAKKAHQYAKKSCYFFRHHLKPAVAAQSKSKQEFRELLINDIKETKHLVKIWDDTVYSSSCEQFIKQLESRDK